jgi:hypothetical protein
LFNATLEIVVILLHTCHGRHTHSQHHFIAIRHSSKGCSAVFVVLRRAQRRQLARPGLRSPRPVKPAPRLRCSSMLCRQFATLDCYTYAQTTYASSQQTPSGITIDTLKEQTAANDGPR